MTLWHFVKDKRRSYVESPIEAEYWIVTVDYRFLAFDRYKTKDQQVAVCIHPAALTQILQFWVPRTDIVDEAMLANLRLPLFFSEFDPEAEKITIKILQTLSRFENVADIPRETVANILLDESLRARMRATQQAEEQVQLIREALIEEQKRLQRELEESKSRLQEKEKETMEKEATIRDLEKEIEQERTKRENIVKELQRLSKEIEELKEKEMRRHQEEERRRTLRSFLILWIGLPSVILILGILGLAFLMLGLGWNLRLLIIPSSLLILFWLQVINRQAKKKSIEHPIVKKLLKFKSWLWGVLISGIVVNALWDWIKALLNR
jgi:ABC-type multidrug transport system fused ATPase/permease subunit